MPGDAILDISGIDVFYGAVQALRGVSFFVERGETVALVGANGAGKSTVLRAISGILRPASGTILFNGNSVSGRAPHRIARLGIAHVPEGRGVFGNMSVRDNLEMGTYARPIPGGGKETIARVYDLFPRLQERSEQLAGTLSGGEQQMLAIGRALMARPELLLLDEPSMGLSPRLVEEIFRLIGEINRAGTTILLVEQNAYMALSVAHRACVLETGEITLRGKASELREDPAVRDAYLGGKDG